jgi:hypothetical protein
MARVEILANKNEREDFITYFRAPETFQPDEPCTELIDEYSVGVIAYLFFIARY